MGTTVDYGIDLGTTNSCIARWEVGAVRVFQNNDQMNVTPSAVHILKTGRVIVGRRAYCSNSDRPRECGRRVQALDGAERSQALPRFSARTFC